MIFIGHFSQTYRLAGPWKKPMGERRKNFTNNMKNTITCILVDDDKVDMLTTVAFLEPYPFIEIAGRFSDPLTALKAATASPPDALFMDIDMPGLSGLQLRKQLMQIPACIFVTSYPDYALESFELDTLDFLVKPFSHDRFAAAVVRLQEFMTIRRKAELLSHTLGADTVFIKDGTTQVKLQLHEMIYLEALNNYTCIVTATRKYTVLSTLNHLIQAEAFKGFVRIHRSYAVQRHFIQKIGSNEVVIGGISLPVGRSYKQTLLGLNRGMR
jgi:two-component system LytT family response regulator